MYKCLVDKHENARKSEEKFDSTPPKICVYRLLNVRKVVSAQKSRFCIKVLDIELKKFNVSSSYLPSRGCAWKHVWQNSVFFIVPSVEDRKRFQERLLVVVRLHCTIQCFENTLIFARTALVCICIAPTFTDLFLYRQFKPHMYSISYIYRFVESWELLLLSGTTLAWIIFFASSRPTNSFGKSEKVLSLEMTKRVSASGAGFFRVVWKWDKSEQAVI